MPYQVVIRKQAKKTLEIPVWRSLEIYHLVVYNYSSRRADAYFKNQAIFTLGCRFKNKENLINAIDEITRGLFDANLGGHIYKKRISIGSKGKRGGARTIIAYKAHNKSLF